MKKFILLGLAVAACATTASANCPTVLADAAKGKYPNQYDLQEFETAHNCKLNFSGNPDAASLNKRIAGNPGLPSVDQRLPSEPLVITPYQKIGKHGGVFSGISKATEAGTSDLLSVRHVNLVRFSDDLATIVPNVAKSWDWNADFTEVTFTLREGHKWSDGQPFTAEDVAFWYNGMVMDKNIIESPADRFLSDGKPMKVEAISASKVRFTLNAPKPGLIAQFATDFAQPFQPTHLLGKFHPSMNKDANQLAQSLGFKDGYEVINFYYGQSDWKDVPQPILKDAAKANKLVEAGFTAVAPTLESFIVVEDTLDGRRLVANPYFFMVDSQGNQLPYINEINEVYIGDEDVQTAKMVAGEVSYKAQSVNLPSGPVLLQNAEKGNYSVELRPTIGMSVFAFNLTTQDESKRAVFNDLNFRKAMSHAINRDQINEIAYFGLGTPLQYTAFDADTAAFVTSDQRNANIRFDQEGAKKLLDAANVKDQDGDGDRDLPNGQELRLNIQFATQGVAAQVAEIIAQNWSDVGVTTSIKEVTSDEYRASQSANELDVHVWNKGEPLAVFLGDTQEIVPPYSGYFGLRNAMLWDQYLNTGGSEGVQPPQTVYEMQKLAREFTTVPAGSSRSNELGRKIAQRTVEDLFFIGTVKAVAPIYFSNNLSNFKVPITSSYSYYRTFPYLAPQWSLN